MIDDEGFIRERSEDDGDFVNGCGYALAATFSLVVIWLVIYLWAHYF